MTVIAYKDSQIACDSRAVCGGLISTAVKFEILDDAILMGAGDLCGFLQLVEWYKNGAKPAEWPTSITRENFTQFVVAKDGKVFEYEHLPYPIECFDTYMAWGNGRDIAMGAMYMGASASQACMAAIAHSTGCGGLVNVFAVPGRT